MGSITVTCNGTSGSKYNLTLNYSLNWQDVASNKSNIYVEMTLQRNDGSSKGYYNYYQDQNNIYLNVNGTRVVTKTLKVDTRNGALVTLATWSGDVIHTSNGSKTVSISGGFTFDSTTLSSGTISDNYVLPTIPRISDFSLSSRTVKAGEDITVTIKPQSTTFSHRVTYAFGSYTMSSLLAVGTITSTKTIPLTWLNEIPNTTSGVGTITVETISDGATIGELTTYFTIECPDNIVPSISSVVVSRVDNEVPSSWGVYVKGESQAKISANASGSYGSTIKSWNITLAGFSSSSNTLTTGILNSAGTFQAVVKVNDSRGRTATNNAYSISVLEYSPPSVTVQQYFRCDSDGTANLSGNNLSLLTSTSYSSINGKNNISLAYNLVRKEQPTGDFITIDPDTAVIIPNVQSIYSYDLTLRISDQIHSFDTIIDITTAQDILNFASGGKGLGIGKVSEKDGLEVEWDAEFYGNIKMGSDNGILKKSNGRFVTATPGKDYVTSEQFADLIQTGSSGGVNWIKFFDGTMIIYSPSYSGTSNATGSFPINFPKSFTSAPALTVNRFMTSQIYPGYRCSIGSVTTNSATIYTINNNSLQYNASFKISFMAIGKWK